MPKSLAIAAPVAVFAGLMASAPALAQPKPLESIDQTEEVPAINAATVSDALAVVTGNQLTGADPEGTPKLIATATNGLRFEINFRACEPLPDSDEMHCKGMYMISSWDPAVAENSAALTDAIAQFLRDNPSVNAGKTNDGAPYLVRYVIADFGTKQGNLVSEFANFIRSATDFQNSIAQYY